MSNPRKAAPPVVPPRPKHSVPGETLFATPKAHATPPDDLKDVVVVIGDANSVLTGCTKRELYQSAPFQALKELLKKTAHVDEWESDEVVLKEKEEAEKQAKAVYESDDYKTMRVTDEAKQFLSDLIQRGARIVLISNTDSPYIKFVLTQSGFNRHLYSKKDTEAKKNPLRVYGVKTIKKIKEKIKSPENGEVESAIAMGVVAQEQDGSITIYGRMC